MSLNTAFTELATAVIGRQVLAEAKDGTDKVSYRVSKLSDKIGSLKDGTKGAYVVLTRDDDTAVVMTLHPAHALRLFKKGSDSGLTLVDEAKVVEDLIAGTTEAELQAELAAEQAADEVKPEVAVEGEKKASKKEQFVALFKSMAGKSRKEVAAEAALLGLSPAGFNTYYQNCRSGKWA